MIKYYNERIALLTIFIVLALNSVAISAPIVITRNAPAFYTPGQSIQVTLIVTTDASSSPYSAIVKEIVPAGWAFVSASPSLS